MSREIPNEIEERRVIRLLAGTAEAIPPLDEGEVGALLRGAAARPCAERPRRSSFRGPHLLSAGAAAAAVALALTLPVRQHEPEHGSSSPRVGSAPHLVAFPEGSALTLLLSRAGKRA